LFFIFCFKNSNLLTRSEENGFHASSHLRHFCLDFMKTFFQQTKKNLLRVKPSIKRLNETRKRETYLTKKVSSKVRKHCKRNKNKKVRFLLNEKSLLFHAAYILCTNSLILPFSVCLSVLLSVFQFLSWNERKKKTSSALLGFNVGFFFCWMQARKKATIINEF